MYLGRINQGITQSLSLAITYVILGDIRVQLLNVLAGSPLAMRHASTHLQVGVGTQDECTRTCGRTHVHTEAFSTIAGILDHIRMHDGCLGAQQDWFNEHCPPHPCVYVVLSRWIHLMNVSYCSLSVRIQDVPIK